MEITIRVQGKVGERVSVTAKEIRSFLDHIGLVQDEEGANYILDQGFKNVVSVLDVVLTHRDFVQKEKKKMSLSNEQLRDIKSLLDNGNELTMWKCLPNEALAGKYGCAFFNPKEEDPPQTSNDAEYGFTVQSAIEKALRRWR